MMSKAYKTGLRYGVLLGVGALVLTGCSFTITVPLLEDVVLPGQGSLLPADMPEEWRELIENWDGSGEPVSLGEICGFDSLQDFRRDILNDPDIEIEGLSPLFLSLVRITGIFIDNVIFEATEGDFGSLRGVGLDVLADGETRVAFVAAAPDGFGEVIDMAATTSYNLVKLFGESSADCIETQLALEGNFPADDVVFDLTMRVTITYRLGLF